MSVSKPSYRPNVHAGADGVNSLKSDRVMKVKKMRFGIAKSENTVFTCLCAHLFVSLQKIGGGSANSFK